MSGHQNTEQSHDTSTARKCGEVQYLGRTIANVNCHDHEVNSTFNL